MTSIDERELTTHMAKVQTERLKFKAEAIRLFVDAGFDPDAAVRACIDEDLGELLGTHPGSATVVGGR